MSSLKTWVLGFSRVQTKVLAIISCPCPINAVFLGMGKGKGDKHHANAFVYTREKTKTQVKKGWVNQMLKIRTSLPNQLIRKNLYVGFSLAFLGGLGFIAGGIMMPLPLLQRWGWLLFLFSLGLITIGLLPYRNLTRLQSKPNELRIVEQGYLEFWARGQCQLLFPLKDIERLQYCEKKDLFGIELWIKEGAKEVKTGHLKKYGLLTGGGDAADLIFQYFSKRSFEELLQDLKLTLRTGSGISAEAKAPDA